MGRNQIYCCICGAPLLEPGQSDDGRGEWLADALLLTTCHETTDAVELDTYWPQPPGGAYSLDLGLNPPAEASRRVLKLEARYSEHNHFQLVQSGESAAAFTVGSQSPTVTSEGCLYLALHGDCGRLVETFIESRPNQKDTFQLGPEEQISSIRQLWEVLSRRMSGSIPLSSEYILPEPHDYYGGKNCRNVYWEPDDDADYGRLLQENPWTIPDLTISILQNLQPIASDVSLQGTSETSDDFQDPNKINRSECDQEWWYAALMNKTLLPWLWDLDVQMIRGKHREGDWNWAQLVSRLSDIRLHEPNDEALAIPLGLRNRRRIWRILEEARIDDVARL